MKAEIICHQLANTTSAIVGHLQTEKQRHQVEQTYGSAEEARSSQSGAFVMRTEGFSVYLLTIPFRVNRPRKVEK